MISPVTNHPSERADNKTLEVPLIHNMREPPIDHLGNLVSPLGEPQESLRGTPRSHWRNSRNVPPCGGTKGGCGWLLPMKVEGMVFVCPIWHGRLALVGSLVCLMYPSYSSPLTGARWFPANYQIPRGAAAGACAMDDVTLGVLGGSLKYLSRGTPNIFWIIPTMPLEESQ